MSRYDYPDPGGDPDYCDGLAPAPSCAHEFASVLDCVNGLDIWACPICDVTWTEPCQRPAALEA